MSYFGCDAITRLYSGKPVVQDVSLSLRQGELACLLGPSGSGKSTLMSVLSGLDRPDSGRVLLDGADITACPGRVSYMLQKDLLLPYKVILDNVALPLLLQGVPKREAHARAGALFARFGLTGCERQYPHQLSGGMRQRAALLRTHLTGSHIMLLDEPFSALDAITKRQMHSWYLSISKELGATTLLITHDVDEALLLADNIHVLAGIPGRITMSIPVEAPGERTADFATSELFLRQKREILRAIEL